MVKLAQSIRLLEIMETIGGFILNFALWALAIIGIVGLAFAVVLIVKMLWMIVKEIENDGCG